MVISVTMVMNATSCPYSYRKKRQSNTATPCKKFDNTTTAGRLDRVGWIQPVNFGVDVSNLLISPTVMQTNRCISIKEALLLLKKCPFISQFKQKVYFNPYIYAKAMKNPKNSKKNNINFSVTWPVSFIGKYLPQFSYASLQANTMGT